MSQYEKYQESHISAHVVLGITFLVMAGVGFYELVSILQNIKSGAAFRLSNTSFAMAACILLVELPLLLEWQCRKKLYPSKKLLLTLAIASGMLILLSKELSHLAYTPYLQAQGYTKCSEYSHNSAASKGRKWEIWALQNQCPANTKK